MTTYSEEYLRGLIDAWIAQMLEKGAVPVLLVTRAGGGPGAGYHCFAADSVTNKEIATTMANILVMMATGGQIDAGEVG